MKRVEKGGGISNEQFKLLSPDKQKIIRDY